MGGGLNMRNNFCDYRVREVSNRDEREILRIYEVVKSSWGLVDTQRERRKCVSSLMTTRINDEKCGVCCECAEEEGGIYARTCREKKALVTRNIWTWRDSPSTRPAEHF